jgi:hypothetical protein
MKRGHTTTTKQEFIFNQKKRQAENLNALGPQKLPWVTKELNGLKNKTTKAARKMKESERRYMVDDDIRECDCERLRGDFTALRSTYQERHELAYDDYCIGIAEEIKTDSKNFFLVC